MSTTSPTQTENRELIDKFQQFFREYYHEDIGVLAQHYPNEQRSLEIDWSDLYKHDHKLADDYLDDPDQLEEYAEEALRLYDLPIDVTLGRAHVRFKNLPDERTYNVGEYRSENIGDYLAVDAQVTKVADVKPWPVEAAFECQRCGTMTRVPQSTTDLQPPHECQGCEREGPFDHRETQSEWVDTQLVKIEQPPEQTISGQGSSTEIRLKDDLVTDPSDGEFKPGDRLTISGIYDVDLDMDSGDVEQFITGKATEVEDNDFKDLNISPDEREEIIAIANGEYGDPFELGVQSIAPKIQGREEIKLAMLLQMFRGVRVKYPDGSVDRGDIHILELGDPGTGKSELLKAVEEIAPRSVYASAKGASAAGMTAAVVPDDFGDVKWSVEAGALVLANNGIACVDEIDKVDDDARSEERRVGKECRL